MATEHGYLYRSIHGYRTLSEENTYGARDKEDVKDFGGVTSIRLGAERRDEERFGGGGGARRDEERFGGGGGARRDEERFGGGGEIGRASCRERV